MKDFCKWLFFGHGMSVELAFAWSFLTIGLIIPGIVIVMEVIAK